ncbi:MAG: iron-containing redox enzyme family protein [Myxococcales bacterium]|nr:iron-containing redox enzyme family protein [Myxococcales bacterium]
MEPTPSWKLLTSGDPATFVAAVCREAKEHPAVHHPYLVRLSQGDLPDIQGALRDYAFQYSFYGTDFVSYLEGVIGSLPFERQRDVIRENLEEEKGDPKSTDLDRIPHVKLFQMFREAIGANEEYRKTNKACTTVLVWRDLFLQKCNSRQLGVALGGMGIGTEYVVPTIYGYILKAIREHTKLSREDAYFFELHSQCDDHHAEDLNNIAVELASEPDVREALRFGALSALNLRKAFWDLMLARAVDMKPA